MTKNYIYCICAALPDRRIFRDFAFRNRSCKFILGFYDLSGFRANHVIRSIFFIYLIWIRKKKPNGLSFQQAMMEKNTYYTRSIKRTERSRNCDFSSFQGCKPLFSIFLAFSCTLSMVLFLRYESLHFRLDFHLAKESVWIYMECCFNIDYNQYFLFTLYLRFIDFILI